MRREAPGSEMWRRAGLSPRQPGGQRVRWLLAVDVMDEVPLVLAASAPSSSALNVQRSKPATGHSFPQL
eukprot:3619763-Prorocentrum_lima.AAC.1